MESRLTHTVLFLACLVLVAFPLCRADTPNEASHNTAQTQSSDNHSSSPTSETGTVYNSDSESAIKQDKIIPFVPVTTENMKKEQRRKTPRREPSDDVVLNVLKYFYPLKEIKVTHENQKSLGLTAAKCLYTFQEKTYALDLKPKYMPEEGSSREWLISPPVHHAFYEYIQRASIDPKAEAGRKETSKQYIGLMMLALKGETPDPSQEPQKSRAEQVQEDNKKKEQPAKRKPLNPVFLSLRNNPAGKTDTSSAKDVKPSDGTIISIIQYFYPKATTVKLEAVNRQHWRGLAASLVSDFNGKTNNAFGLKPSLLAMARNANWVTNEDVLNELNEFLSKPAAAKAFESARKEVALNHNADFTLLANNLTGAGPEAVPDQIATHAAAGRGGTPVLVSNTKHSYQMQAVVGDPSGMPNPGNAPIPGSSSSSSLQPATK